MQKMSLLAKALPVLLVSIAVTASPASAFDGCRAADISGDGQVDFWDISLIQAAMGQPSSLFPREDLDGSGFVDLADFRIVYGFVFQTCTDCTADLDGSLVVDGQDRILLEAAYGRECRLDMDRNGPVDDDNDPDIWVLYFQSLPNPATERADFDGNGIVNFIDISLLLPSIGNDCRYDLNFDGAVNTNDLWALLASWGPCP